MLCCNELYGIEWVVTAPKWRLESRLLTSLRPFEHNPRRIMAKPLADLTKSIDKFGLAEPLVIQPDGLIIGGHARYQVLLAQGVKEADCYVPDRALSQKDMIELNVRLNRNIAGEFDFDMLANLPEIDIADLVEFGFDEAELGVAPDVTDAEPQIDRAAELNKKWQVNTGDLWQIGEHRLLCGDSTKREDVERVMGEGISMLIATDPPYGVDYANVLGVRPRQKEGGWNEIEGDDLDDAALEAMLVASLEIVAAPVLFCWHSWRRVEVFLRAIRQCGWTPNGEIVWVKPGLTMGMSDYQWQHECCIYAKRKGAGRQPDRTCSSVWQVSRISNGTHPTQKPVEIFQIPIQNHTKTSDICYDPFLGSGTTMVACENLKRKCRGIEISPDYCAVILQRMSDAFPKLTIERHS